MPKSIVFNIGKGDLSKGFPYSVRIEDENNDLIQDISSLELKANTELESLCSQWRSNHKDANTRAFNEIVKNPDELPRFYGESTLETQYRAKIKPTKPVTDREIQTIVSKFEVEINRWLANEEFDEIIAELKNSQQLHKDEEIRCIIRTKDNTLKSIPWHLWKFFDEFSQAKTAFSTSKIKRVSPPNNNKEQLNVLAILGNDDGINLEKDREFLNKFAKTEFLVKPSRTELETRLRDKEQSLDILFFAGHSKTEAEKGGIIHLNDTEELEINALKDVLQLATSNGLQLAIFNSCDGLGIADELARLQIPQVIVMRELVPNLVAQEFLKRFLDCLSHGFPFYSAFRTSRSALKAYEEKFPFASWLPTLFQNQSQSPSQWNRFGLDSILKKTKLLDSSLKYLTLDEYEKSLELYSPAFKFSKNAKKIEDIVEYYRKIVDKRSAALKKKEDNIEQCNKIRHRKKAATKLYQHFLNINKNYTLYKKTYGGEDISLVDGLLANNAFKIADYSNLIKICQENSDLEVLFALVIQGLYRIKDKNVCNSIAYNNYIISELCELVNSRKSLLLAWSAATVLSVLNIKHSKNRSNVPKDCQTIAEKIVGEQIEKISSINSVGKNEYEELIKFWLYGARYQLRCLTNSFKFQDTFSLWRKNYRNNVTENLFDVCWNVSQELGMRGILEETILFTRAALSTSSVPIDRNELFQGIALELATTPIDWVKYPYKEAVCINYCLLRQASGDEDTKTKFTKRLQNRNWLGINILNLKASISNWKRFSIFKKNNFVTSQSNEYELFILTNDLKLNYDDIVKFYSATKIHKFLVTQCKELSTNIENFETIYTSKSRFILNLILNKIRCRVLSSEEITAITIILNRIYSLQIINDFIDKRKYISEINEYNLSVDIYNSGILENYSDLNNKHRILIEESLVEPKTLKEYATSLAKIDFLLDFFSNIQNEELKSTLQQQSEALRNYPRWEKEFKKWKNCIHDSDLDYLITKRELCNKFNIRYPKPERPKIYRKNAEKHRPDNLACAFHLLNIYSFTHDFLCLHPLLYNLVRTNYLFIQWKKSTAKAIGYCSQKHNDYEALYKNTIVNYRALSNEIVILIEKELNYAKNRQIKERKTIAYPPEYTSEKARYIGNANIIDINFISNIEYLNSLENKLSREKQIELKKQDIITYTCQLKLFRDGVDKIFTLDEAIRSNDRSTYITKLTDIAYLPERLNEYKEFVLENHGNLYWDEEEDFIESQEYDNQTSNIDWSQANQLFWLPSVLIMLSSNFIVKIVYAIAKLGYELLSDISIIRYSLWTILAFSIIITIITIVNQELEESKKNALNVTINAALAILGVLLILSIILFFICSWFVCLNEFNWLFNVMIANGKFIHRFFGVSAILVTLLINRIIYILSLSHFWEQRQRSNKN